MVHFGKWLNRLRFKTLHREYCDDVLSYFEYKERVFIMVNSIRKAESLPEYSEAKFDEGWQYRNLCADNYAHALDEMSNLIFGWW